MASMELKNKQNVFIINYKISESRKEKKNVNNNKKIIIIRLIILPSYICYRYLTF